MSASFPPKRAVALTFYTSLRPQGSVGVFQANPTLASGDVKVSKDGGAFANLTTLPTVTPASGKVVKVWLSATEMTADDVAVLFSDAAGAEWCDQLLSFKTSTRQIDDLVSAGVGALAINIRCRVSGVAVEGASVWVTTGADGSGIVSGPLTTSSLGIVAVLLDAGAYYVWVQKDGYTPHAGDTWVVTDTTQLEVAMVASAATTTTMTTLRTRLRKELMDEDSAAYRWTNTELDRHLERAKNEFSVFAPRERKSTVPTSAGSRALSMTALTNLVRVDAVEWPAGEFPPVFVPYQLHAGVLELMGDEEPSAVENTYVYWGQVHTLDESSSTIPVVAEDYVVLGAAGYALEALASYTGNRANVAGAAAAESYIAQARDRIGRFREWSREFGDRSRINLRLSYTPDSAGGRDVVRWPSA